MKRGRALINTKPPKLSKPTKRARKDSDKSSTPPLRTSGLRVHKPDASDVAKMFFNHFREQDDCAQYGDDVACSIRINIPDQSQGGVVIGFDWVNNGIERDHFVVMPWSLTGDISPLDAFFKSFHTKSLWGSSGSEIKIAVETLTNYFKTIPKATIIIDSWGEDPRVRGGKIGHETGFRWVPNEKDRWDEDNSD